MPVSVIAITKEEWMARAVNHNKGTVMNISQFAAVINRRICSDTFDLFYHSVKESRSIYLSNEVVEWFGYGGTEKQQRQSVVELLKKNITLTDMNGLDSKMIVQIYVNIFSSACCDARITISADIFKSMVMSADSPIAAAIQYKYTNLEYVISQYDQYVYKAHKIVGLLLTDLLFLAPDFKVEFGMSKI
jgi:hypothetical protein